MCKLWIQFSSRPNFGLNCSCLFYYHVSWDVMVAPILGVQCLLWLCYLLKRNVLGCVLPPRRRSGSYEQLKLEEEGYYGFSSLHCVISTISFPQLNKFLFPLAHIMLKDFPRETFLSRLPNHACFYLQYLSLGWDGSKANSTAKNK